MQTAAILLALLLILLIGGALLYFSTRSKRPQINSFWDVVRNPEAMSDLEAFHKEVDDAAASLSGSSTRIAELVDYFAFEVKSSRDAWTELRILAKLGSQANPRALEILRDPALKERLTALTEYEHALPEAPINRLCKIFDQDTPPPGEAAGLLAPYLQAESDEIRKSAALIVGSIGSLQSLSDLRRALTDENEYVRSYVLMGLERAISGGRIELSSKDEFFALVANMWPGDTSFSVCDSIPLILLKLDRDRAIDYLLGDELFSVGFGPIWRILQAFNEESVECPRTRILGIIEDACKTPMKSPRDDILEQALPLLGSHRNEADLAMLERLLDHENADVSQAATEALYRFHRYYDRIRDPWSVVKARGWDALTVAEKHLCAIQQLDAEVNNGGFAQYYFNSSGDHWEDAQDALAAIGAPRRHRLMVATVEKFGKTRPAAKREGRTAQLSQLVRREQGPFNEQDAAWYRIDDENLKLLLFKYNLANLDGRQKPAQTDELDLK